MTTLSEKLRALAGARALEGWTVRRVCEALGPLAAEAEALEQDAARYRVLRDLDNWPAAFLDHDDPEPLRGSFLDEACDTAMQTTRGYLRLCAASD